MGDTVVQSFSQFHFLWHHGLQQARLPCYSLSPGVCSNSYPLSRSFHPTISSSFASFSSCPQSFPASGYLQMSWLFTQRPKYWSFNFSISPSSGYSGLISFMIDWFDLLAVEGTLKSLPQHHNLKASVLQCLLYGPTLISIDKPELWLHRPLSAKWCIFSLICYLGLHRLPWWLRW